MHKCVATCNLHQHITLTHTHWQSHSEEERGRTAFSWPLKCVSSEGYARRDWNFRAGAEGVGACVCGNLKIWLTFWRVSVMSQQSKSRSCASSGLDLNRKSPWWIAYTPRAIAFNHTPLHQSSICCNSLNIQVQHRLKELFQFHNNKTRQSRQTADDWDYLISLQFVIKTQKIKNVIKATRNADKATSHCSHFARSGDGDKGDKN